MSWPKVVRSLLWHRIKFDDPAIDAKLNQASVEPDPVKRRALYTGVLSWLFDEAYYIWGAVPLNIYVKRDWAKGWFYNPMFGRPDTTPAVFGMYKEERTDQVAITVQPLAHSIATMVVPAVPNCSRKNA